MLPMGWSVGEDGIREKRWCDATAREFAGLPEWLHRQDGADPTAENAELLRRRLRSSNNESSRRTSRARESDDVDEAEGRLHHLFDTFALRGRLDRDGEELLNCEALSRKQ